MKSEWKELAAPDIEVAEGNSLRGVIVKHYEISGRRCRIELSARPHY